ncbi:AFG1-like ATPase-domain-containing protein [Diaporthe sp. PMI_573]|nr:AFG1-like ATPase-domain-containing protein [Diaporthaceae sp. PMI_573]
MKRLGTAVTITDPLVKYNALLATGTFHPDPAQHRLAHHLQKLYLRLKDYQPSTEYRTKLRQITESIGGAREKETDQLAVRSHPIRRNPLFAKFFRSTEGPRDSLSLTRILTSHEAAIDIDSPTGLFLSGEVGTGKSMLLDLLADGLPTSRKRRWHFNTFMLYAFSRLEHFRTSRPNIAREDQGWSLPDRAAAKILSNLFIAFFQLGGVLVASSNRMPDELEKATGTYGSPPPPTGGLVRSVFGMGAKKQKGELFGSTSDFAAFLEVLKARCDFWHMEGAQDWRRRDMQEHLGLQLKAATAPASTASHSALENPDSNLLLVRDNMGDSTTPRKYALTVDSPQSWDQMVLETVNNPLLSSIPWEPTTLVVYGRLVNVPRQYQGFTHWDFDELVHKFGPADYVTLASNYHTWIIDKVPVLPVTMKNEARRFITLLDALYEARCKVLIRAEVGPDNLFFPEQNRRKSSKAGLTTITRSSSNTKTTITTEEGEHEDATYSETISEVYQDSAAPFRPNISSYNEGPSSSANKTASIHAEIDSDFGILGQKVDFVNISAFTGEDERFAYKRAASRLWELCSASWHGRLGPPDAWWSPVPPEARHWESKEPTKPLDMSYSAQSKTPGDVAWGPSVDLEEPAGLSRLRVDELKNGRRD